MELIGTFAWPLVVLVLVAFALVLFKNQIRSFIDRSYQFKLGPAALSSRQHSKEIVNDLLDTDTKNLFREFDNPLVTRVEEAVKKDLEGRKISSYVEREHLLIRHYAVAVLALNAERVYNFIWGSQINLLVHLNGRGNSGCNAEEIRSFYDMGKSNYPQFYLNYSFEQWLQFMENFSLICRQGPVFLINLEGREFLKYLLDRQYVVQKLG